jgi:hypothetical protein
VELNDEGLWKKSFKESFRFGFVRLDITVPVVFLPKEVIRHSSATVLSDIGDGLASRAWTQKQNQQISNRNRMDMMCSFL